MTDENFAQYMKSTGLWQQQVATLYFYMSAYCMVATFAITIFDMIYWPWNVVTLSIWLVLAITGGFAIPTAAIRKVYELSATEGTYENRPNVQNFTMKSNVGRYCLRATVERWLERGSQPPAEAADRALRGDPPC